MAWTKSTCIAKQGLSTLDFQSTTSTFLIIRLHDPTFDTTDPNIADRDPTYTGA